LNRSGKTSDCSGSKISDSSVTTNDEIFLGNQHEQPEETQQVS
jgi:hypothetical protein